MDETYAEVEAWRKRLEIFAKNVKRCSLADKTVGYLEARLEGLGELYEQMCIKCNRIDEIRASRNMCESYFDRWKKNVS